MGYVVWGAFLAVCFALVRYGPADWRWGVVAVAAGAPLAYRALVNARARKYDIEAASAVQALRRGQPAQAERDLIALRARFRWPGALPNLTSYNLALALHQQGRHAEAIEALAEADRAGGAVTIDPAIASTLALCHALLDHVDLAQSWLTEARRRYAGRVVAQRFPELVSEVALALRRGEYAEVCRRFDADWLEILNSRTAETLNTLRILRAFAIARSGGPPAETSALVIALQPRRPTDFAFLSTDWPELRDFLATAVQSPTPEPAPTIN